MADALPFTPRALTAEHAAIYVGMSESQCGSRGAAGNATLRCEAADG